MNHKHIGIILILLAIALAAVTGMWKQKEDFYIEHLIEIHGGECMLSDGTCLHGDRSYTYLIAGFVIAGALLLLGIYLFSIDLSNRKITDNQAKISQALAIAKIAEKEKDEWGAFLKGFSEDERKILTIVKNQEGIKQSTLRYKTGFSKTKLSQSLYSLEKKEAIRRREKGKSKEVYLGN